MTRMLSLLILMICVAVPRTMASAQENHDMQPKLGIELHAGQPEKMVNLTVQIKNSGTKEISIQAKDFKLFATKPSLNWPLNITLGTPSKVVTPNLRSNGAPEIAVVDPKQSDEFRLKPGQYLIYELNIKKILTERRWEWPARPGPPESPITNAKGGQTLNPIALWVELPHKNKWIASGLCSRPVLIYPEKYIGTKTDESKADEK